VSWSEGGLRTGGGECVAARGALVCCVCVTALCHILSPRQASGRSLHAESQPCQVWEEKGPTPPSVGRIPLENQGAGSLKAGIVSASLELRL